jgi:hypothetical protein
MYEGWTRLLIVFLTHVLIVGALPSSGILFSILRGLVQASAVVTLHLASETTLAVVTEYLYWAAFVFWVYLKVEKES